MKLKLLSKQPQVGNIKTFRFETNGLEWLAGQSQGYDLLQAGETQAEHQRWFTISSAPSEGTINITTRVSQSSFKQALDQLEPGQEIEAHDVGGDFTWEDDKPVVLVAGGIGITPFRSMLAERETIGKAIPAHLIYFNRNDEIAFKEELEQIDNNHPEFKISYIIGEPVTAEKVLQLAPEVKEQITYLSGPEPMVEAVGADLTWKSVQVVQDWFPGYDEDSY